jgi:hypothetical protein
VKEKTMSRTTMLKAARNLVVSGVFAAAAAVLMGFHASEASAEPRTWSIAAHFAYQDGFEYDYIFARGVSTEDMPNILAECGNSHWTGSVVRYHCFPIPE